MAGCNFSKSVKKDLVSGLVLTGNGLTCEDVYITVNNERTSKTSFTYGETAYLIFSDIKGFKAENNSVYPLMEILVSDAKGDTMLFADNLYGEYTDGMSYSPLELTADLTVATPIRSGGEYTMKVHIKDRKGPGTYSSALNFTVESNGNIKTEPRKVTFNEAYVYSQGKEKVVNDGKISPDDNIYIIVEGLKGINEENGRTYPALSLKVTDSAGTTMIENDDLLAEYSESGVDPADLSSRISSHFKISGTDFRNPLHCLMTVWDRKSEAKVTVSTDLSVE